MKLLITYIQDDYQLHKFCYHKPRYIFFIQVFYTIIHKSENSVKYNNNKYKYWKLTEYITGYTVA